MWIAKSFAAGALICLVACGGGGGSAQPPTITTQPASQTVTSGSSVTFTVVASGAASYQWDRNGQPIAGATSTSYTLSPATATNNGASYTVVVSNAAGSVTSSAAALRVNASPGGIWVGTDSSYTFTVLGLVAETGELFFSDTGVTSNGVYYVGQFTSEGNAINANVDAITAPFSIYPDRGTTGTGDLDGTITERTSFDGGSSITTGPDAIGGGRVWPSTFSVTFSSQYNRASSLAIIAGNYGAGSLALTISSDGVLSAQDSGTGCTINGNVATIDPNYNMYAVTLSTVNCAAEFNVPDGAQLKGLATLNNSQSPEYLVIGAADTTSATWSAMMFTVNRM
jgi:Immunoglobulin domain